MKGLEMFEGIYDEEVDHVTGKLERVLKPILHCKANCRIIVDDDVRLKGINMMVLTANRYTDRSLLTGRTIWDMGKQVEENGKKVLAIVLRSSKYRAASLPSGEQWEDYLKFCRYKMAKEVQESKKKSRQTKVQWKVQWQQPQQWKEDLTPTTMLVARLQVLLLL